MGIRDILLNEKVSQKEINDALNNQNIYIGAEFEFRIPAFVDKYKEKLDNYEKLQEMLGDYEDYNEAFEEWNDDPDNNEMPELPQWAIEHGYEAGEEIVPPEELYPHYEVNNEKMFNKLIKEFLPLKKLPFSNPIISADSYNKSASQWVIKPDGSLGLSGVEIVSPVLPLKEFLKICPKMFEFIDEIGGEVGDDCGFHISMSLKNVTDLGNQLDITKLSLFMDEGYIYNFFKTREFNSYAKSAHDAVNRSLIGLNAPKLAEHLIDEDQMKKDFMKKSKSKGKDNEKFAYSNEHYMAINIEHLFSANEYIEFRYIGGENYHRKWDRIKTITAHYIYDLSLACDPSFKKKEYETKMARVMNKIQFFTICIEMSKILENIENGELDKNDYDVKSEWNNLWQSWNALKLYKEAVDNDKNSTNAKKGFERMCAMLGVTEDDVIWDYSKMKYLK